MENGIRPLVETMLRQAAVGAPAVTVKPASALNKQIDWRQSAHHVIEVEIETLLDYLGSYYDRRLCSRARFPKSM
jgi:hypothetical protein